MLLYINCFKCEIQFEDRYDKYSICYVCRKAFCVECYGKHEHNNVEKNYEILFNIIKDKTNALYKPLTKYDWNNLIEIEQDSIRELMMTRIIIRQKYDFMSFHRQLFNIKERFNYLFIEMILSKKFCFEIYELILSFI